MNNNAEESYEKELTPQTWAETFDEKNKIKTPLGLVKMGDGQISKFFEKNRTKEFGMVGPTLANPDIIIAEPSEAKDGNSERDSSFLFIKTFKRNGETIKYYASITVKQDGMEVSISSHYMNKNKVKKAMNEVVLYIREALLSNSSEWRLAEHQDDVPDLLPTQEGNASESKDSKTSLNTSGIGENNHLSITENKSKPAEAEVTEQPIVQAGTMLKNNEAGGDAVAVVVGSEVKNGECRYMVSFAPDKESAEAKLFFGDKWMSESELQQWLDDGRFAEYKNVKKTDSLLNDKEVSEMISAMKAKAVPVPFIKITDSNWRDSINTPIGAVKMGENQRTKLFSKGREQQYGMLVESLYNPDIILEEKDKETDMFHERPFSYLFIKTFVKEDGGKFVHFESVTVSQEGLEVSISSHIIRENQLKNKLKSDRLLYKATALDEPANSSAEQPTNTGGSLSSENKDSKPATEKQADGDKSSETNTPIVPRMDGYTIESRKDTRDNSDLFAVKFDERVSKDEFKGQKEIAKKFGGYWSNFGKKGFLFKSEESAHDFAETVMGRTVEEVEDEAPISIASITKKNDPNAAEYNGETYYIGDEVILNGIRGRVVAINRWKCPVVQTEHATIALRYNGTDDLTHYVESEEEIPNNKTNGVSKPEDPYHTDEERAHYEELKKRMRAKLNQLNSGIDPELLEIGVEMAFFHFKGGMRHFADFCKTMIEDCGDKIRPHLKMLYNAAAGTEDFIVRGWDEEMDDRKTVRDFDVYNFDKSTVDVIETAQHVVEEAESMQQGEQISFKQLY